jgi:hypothetical protein
MFILILRPFLYRITSYCIVSYYNMTQYITSNHITSNHITSNHITSNQIKSNQIKSNQIKSNQIKSNQITSHYIKSNQIKSNQITSHHIIIILLQVTTMTKTGSNGTVSEEQTGSFLFLGKHSLSRLLTVIQSLFFSFFLPLTYASYLLTHYNILLIFKITPLFSCTCHSLPLYSFLFFLLTATY